MFFNTIHPVAVVRTDWMNIKAAGRQMPQWGTLYCSILLRPETAFYTPDPPALSNLFWMSLRNKYLHRLLNSFDLSRANRQHFDFTICSEGIRTKQRTAKFLG